MSTHTHTHLVVHKNLMTCTEDQFANIYIQLPRLNLYRQQSHQLCQEDEDVESHEADLGGVNPDHPEETVQDASLPPIRSHAVVLSPHHLVPARLLLRL